MLFLAMRDNMRVMIYLLLSSKGLSSATQAYVVVAAKENENIFFAYGHFCVANSRGVIGLAYLLWRGHHINKWS